MNGNDTRPITVVLVDDHELVRAGVRRVLESLDTVQVVGEGATAAEALTLVERERPDVLLLDLNLPEVDGFQVMRQLRESGATTRVLVLSLHAEPAFVQRAVREGAAGYLVKDLAVQELGDAIQITAQGEAFFSARAQQALAAATRGEGATPLDVLTPRELEVLVDVARGLPTKAIAASRNISPRTVDSHRASLLRKLGVRSVAELTRIAVSEGLLGPESSAP